MWIAADHDRPGRLSESNELVLTALRVAGISTQLWVGISANYFAGLDDEDAVARGEN